MIRFLIFPRLHQHRRFVSDGRSRFHAWRAKWTEVGDLLAAIYGMFSPDSTWKLFFDNDKENIDGQWQGKCSLTTLCLCQGAKHLVEDHNIVPATVPQEKKTSQVPMILGSGIGSFTGLFIQIKYQKFSLDSLPKI